MKKFVLIPTDKYERLLKGTTASLLDENQPSHYQQKEDISAKSVPNINED